MENERIIFRLLAVVQDLKDAYGADDLADIYSCIGDAEVRLNDLIEKLDEENHQEPLRLLLFGCRIITTGTESLEV